MRSLRQHVREVQILENKAAEKAGMRFLLSMDERKLLDKKNKAFIDDYTETLLDDISPELIKAAKIGKELHKEVIQE